MIQEESMVAKRLLDLSRRAYQKGIVTFSDFLNLNEQNIFHTCIPMLESSYQMSGGFDYAERQMIAFLPDALIFEPEFPMTCLKIVPVNQKFADVLSHRDVLGSLMSLGIERGRLGDIMIKDQQIYVFCHNAIQSYLREELTKIRHTPVSVSIETNIPDLRPSVQACQGIITSNRLDAFVAHMCKLSRSRAGDLIKGGSVFINGKVIQSTSIRCKPGEIISVRGVGRFRFLESSGETKKGRIKIQYEKYTG